MNQYFDADCVFCREIGGQQETNFARLYPDLAAQGRFKLQNEDFVSFPCIGQLDKTHMLIVPRRHFQTMRDACMENAGAAANFKGILHQVTEHFEAISENAFFFEHGVSDPAGGGCGIYHAHLHVIQGLQHIEPMQVGKFTSPKISTDIHGALTSITIKGNYILAGSGAKGIYIESIASPLESQTLRKNIADVLEHKPEWDWHLAGREQSVIDIIEGST